MPNKVKIELNSAGVRELLQSPEMLALCTSHAESMAAELGSGYEVDAFIGHDRAHAIVKAVSAAAIRDNLENNTILKAVNHD